METVCKQKGTGLGPVSPPLTLLPPSLPHRLLPLCTISTSSFPFQSNSNVNFVCFPLDASVRDGNQFFSSRFPLTREGHLITNFPNELFPTHLFKHSTSLGFCSLLFLEWLSMPFLPGELSSGDKDISSSVTVSRAPFSLKLSRMSSCFSLLLRLPTQAL